MTDSDEVKLLPCDQMRLFLIGWLNAFKADPFSTGVDKVDRLLEITRPPVVTDEVVELPRKALLEAREYLEGFRLKEAGAARMREIDRMPVRQLCRLIDEVLALASMPAVVSGGQGE